MRAQHLKVQPVESSSAGITPPPIARRNTPSQETASRVLDVAEPSRNDALFINETQ